MHPSCTDGDILPVPSVNPKATQARLARGMGRAMPSQTESETMSFFEPITTISEALNTLRNEGTHKTEDNTDNNITELNPRDIQRFVAVFQPRSLSGRLIVDEAHIAVLMEAVGKPEKPKFLDPLLVWWSGVNWYVIDGFHRLQAYQRVGVQQAVPVKAFDGTIEQAMAEAAAANSKDKLPMTKKDKMNMAWRLVRCSEKLSKAETAKACAISPRSVAIMRRVKEQWLASGETLDDLSDDWDKARREAQGVEADGSFDPDDHLKKKVEKMAKALAKTFGQTMHQDPTAFALALMEADERLPGRLIGSGMWDDILKAEVEARKDLGEWHDNDDY